MRYRIRILPGMILLFVLVFTFFDGDESFCASPDTLKIILISDTHVCNLTGYHPLFMERRAHYGDGFSKLIRFFHSVPVRYDADAVVITGDLTDYFEAARPDGRFLETQIEQFASLWPECPVPLYMILGNHDISSYWVEAPGEIRSFQTCAEQARAAWIRNIPCFQSGTYYARLFQVGRTRYHFLFLDNGYAYRSGAVVDQAQLNWIEHQVRQAGTDPVVVFMHKYIPFPDNNKDGRTFTSRTSLVIDSTTCSDGFLRVLNENKNIKALMVGHGHSNVTESVPFPGGHLIVQTETGGFAQNTDQWRMMKLTEDKIIILPCGDDKERTVIWTNAYKSIGFWTPGLIRVLR